MPARWRRLQAPARAAFERTCAVSIASHVGYCQPGTVTSHQRRRHAAARGYHFIETHCASQNKRAQ